MRLLLLILLIAMVPVFGQTNQWKGLIPFQSNRKEVVKTLGACKERDKSYCLYEMADENILIHYSPGRCAEGGAWNIQAGLIEHIDIHFPKPKKTNFFSVNWSDFVAVDDAELPGIKWLSNDGDGVSFVVENGLVRAMYLAPPTRVLDKLRCSTAKKKTEN